MARRDSLSRKFSVETMIMNRSLCGDWKRPWQYENANIAHTLLLGALRDIAFSDREVRGSPEIHGRGVVTV